MYFIKVENGKIIGKGNTTDENTKIDHFNLKVTAKIFKDITSLPCGYFIIKKTGDTITEIQLDETDLQEQKINNLLTPTKKEIQGAQRQIQLINDLNELGVL